MTLKEFIPILRTIKFAYKKFELFKEKEETDLWMRLLADLDAKSVSDAVDKYIMENQFPPTIADIRRLCEIEREQESKLRAEMREIFETAIGGYPGINRIQGNTMICWNYLTAADTWDERVEKAKRLESQISEYVRTAEISGEINDIVTFTEFLDMAYEAERQNELYS